MVANTTQCHHITTAIYEFLNVSSTLRVSNVTLCGQHRPYRVVIACLMASNNSTCLELEATGEKVIEFERSTETKEGGFPCGADSLCARTFHMVDESSNRPLGGSVEVTTDHEAPRAGRKHMVSNRSILCNLESMRKGGNLCVDTPSVHVDWMGASNGLDGDRSVYRNTSHPHKRGEVRQADNRRLSNGASSQNRVAKGFARVFVFTASAVDRIESECCLLYTSPSPRDQRGSRMPSSA